MKRVIAVPTLLVALVACEEPTKSSTADSETSTRLSVETTAGTFTVSVRTPGATGPSLAVFSSGVDRTCESEMPPGTYIGNVVVNPGGPCKLSGSTVMGNLIVRENSTLLADNNDIRGNVELLQSHLVSLSDNVIGGSILSEKPQFGLDIHRNQIGGSVLVKEGMAFVGVCGNTLKNGPIVIEKNRSSSILVGGDRCVGFGGGNVLENVDSKVVENEVLPVTGVDATGLQVGDNQVGQHLQVFKNRGGLPKAVTRNTVGGSLQCFENTAPFVGGPNVAQEAEGDCTGSPPVVAPPPPPSPPAAVFSVTVAPSTATVDQGKTVQLIATTRDASNNVLTGRAVTWASSNTAVATVLSNGLVTGVAPSAQPATITATSEGIPGTAQITVKAPVAGVASVVLTPLTATINAINGVQQFSASAKDASGVEVPGATFTWTSSSPAVATVDAVGRVTAKTIGTALIVAATAGISSNTASVLVQQVPAQLELNPTSAAVVVGSTAQLQATVRDAGGTAIPNSPVTWSSSAPGIASVSPSGLVTGLAAGPATVTANAAELSAPASITVTVPPPPLPPPSTSGIWISPAEIAALPMSGTPWNTVKAEADRICGTPNLANQNDLANVCIMAKALVFARTNQPVYRDGVVTALRSIVNSGTYNGQCLSLGRELAAYVIAADLISLRTYDPGLDEQFRAKLRELRSTRTTDAWGTIIRCQEVRPNNWGTMNGATRVAIAVYLGDQADLDRAALVFRGYLGDRTAYAGFTYGELSWQYDASKPVGINPKGATKQGRNIDGVQPDDQRRCGSFSWPPCATNYAWEVLQGSLAVAWMLHRQGYPAFEWSDRALLRAVTWLYQVANNPAVGDDTWQPHLINHVYGTTYPAATPTQPGKNVGWTDWTHPPR